MRMGLTIATYDASSTTICTSWRGSAWYWIGKPLMPQSSDHSQKPGDRGENCMCSGKTCRNGLTVLAEH
eukprot:s3625_g6.t1